MRVLAAFPLAFVAIASANAPAAPPASALQPAAPSASAARNGEIRLKASDDCRSDRVRTAAFELDRVPAQRLDRLPAGNLDLAVMREVGGCPEPVTIRENYGAMGMRAPPATRPERPALPRTRLLDR